MDQYSIFDALNLAISPVIMISAYGMLLLSLTNRLGRAIDRARVLAGESGASRQLQVEILAKRARRLCGCGGSCGGRGGGGNGAAAAAAAAAAPAGATAAAAAAAATALATA